MTRARGILCAALFALAALVAGTVALAIEFGAVLQGQWL